MSLVIKPTNFQMSDSTPDLLQISLAINGVIK